jgi:hypothetical protein
MIRLRLDDSLRVLSVTSAEGGNHLFFRVRNQNSVMVALGPLTMAQEFSLTVRYAGTHKPEAVEREVLQFAPPEPAPSQEDIPLEPALVYANRTAWYPYASADDYALATVRIDTPRDYTGITGGVRTVARVEGARRSWVPPGPAGQVHHARGRPLSRRARGRRAPWPPQLRPEPDPGPRRACSRAGRDPPFFEGEFGPSPTLALVAIEG